MALANRQRLAAWSWRRQVERAACALPPTLAARPTGSHTVAGTAVRDAIELALALSDPSYPIYPLRRRYVVAELVSLRSPLTSP